MLWKIKKPFYRVTAAHSFMSKNIYVLLCDAELYSQALKRDSHEFVQY